MLFNFHYWAGFGDDGETFYVNSITTNCNSRVQLHKLHLDLVRMPETVFTVMVMMIIMQNHLKTFHNEKRSNIKIGALSSISKVVTLFNLFSGWEFMLLKFNLSFFVPGSRFLWIMELAHFASVLSRLASGQFQIKANAKNISFYENLEFSSA